MIFFNPDNTFYYYLLPILHIGLGAA